MKKLISGILMITMFMITLPIFAAASTLPEGYEVTDYRFFINDELQQITVYRNQNFFQSDKKEYVPLQACMEALGCTFERKSATNIMIITPDNRTIDMSIGEKTIRYTGGLNGVDRVPWEYMELDGAIYYPLYEFPELIDCEILYEGNNIYLDSGEYLQKNYSNDSVGRKVNIDVYVNDIKIDTPVYHNRKSPSVQGPYNLNDYVQLKPILDVLGLDLPATAGWYYLMGEPAEIGGEIYVPFSAIRYNINGSLKQDDYDSMYLYSADYVRQDIPATLEDAYKALDELLYPEEIAYIKNLAEDDMIELHFSLGLWIRNNWLYPTNSRLTKAVLEQNPDVSHPDDMSYFILVGYHRYLNNGSTSTPPTLPENNNITFSDVTETHWAYNDIMSLTKSGVLNGYEDGTFRPDNYVTQAEMAKIITIAFDLQGNSKENPDETTNADTLKKNIKKNSPNEWWSEFALIAVDYYHAGGHSSVYNSDEEANRRQVAVALVNILNPEYGFDYTTAGYIFPSNWKDILRNEFVDFAENDEWDDDRYIDYEDGYFVNSPKQIYLAKTMGLISGYPDGTFRPLGNITRAEFCAMVNRALDLRSHN